MQISVETSAGMQSSPENTAEIPHIELCGDLGRKSEGRIWAKSLQNSALRISSQLSAQFSLHNFVQNGCRISAELCFHATNLWNLLQNFHMQKQTEIVWEFPQKSIFNCRRYIAEVFEHFAKRLPNCSQNGAKW